MTPTRTDIVEALSFDGPLSVWQGVVLGCALAAMAYYTLFHVPQRAKRRVAPVLWLLRVAAIIILILILIGPVTVTSYRHSSPRSLAVVTDISGSMSIVDPPDARPDLRWRASGEADPGSALMSVCDRAAVAAAAARDNLTWLMQEEERTSRPEEARRRIHTAGRAAEKSLELTQSICDLMKSGPASSNLELVRQANDLSSALSAAKLNQIESNLAQKSTGPISFATEQLNQLEDWQRQLVQSARGLTSLSEQVLTQLASNPPAAATGSTEALARGEKVSRLIESAEKKWAEKKENATSIRRYTFAQDAASLSSDTPEKPKEPAPPSEPKPVAGIDDAKKKAESFTNLSSVLERLNQDAGQTGIEAVLLFSDGRHNDPKAEDPRLVAKAFGDLPVYTVSVGSSRMQRDLVLHHVDAPTAVVQGDQVVVEAILGAFACDGESTTIELMEGKEVVAREEIRVDSPRRDFRVRLVASAKNVGRHEYSLAATELKEEAVVTNNVATFGVDVIDSTLKVLIADDMPRWEYRYLVNLFERDERIEYEQLLFHPKAKASGQLAIQMQLPKDVDGWAQYRVAILGDLSPAEFDQESQKALAQYVTERGGTVILIAGSEAMPQQFAGQPLGDLLPVNAADASDPAQGFELELSPEARLIPAMQISDQAGGSEDVWKEMSHRLPIYALSSFCAPKPTARTLIRARPAAAQGASGDAESAFLCWQTVGRGRVVYIAAPAVYQLRLRHGDRYHYRFWGQLIRWAVARDLSQGSKTVKLATDRSRASVGQNVQIVANLSDPGGQPVRDAEVRAQASMNQTAVALVELKADPNIPGRYLGEYVPADEGTLTFQAFGTDVTQLLQTEGVSNPIETSLVIDPMQSTETEDTRANAPLLHQIAQLTHGQVVPPTAVQELVELTDLDPNVTEETVRAPTWNRWNFLWLICGVLSIEWTIRKKTGLP